MDSKSIVIQRIEKKLAASKRTIKVWVPLCLVAGLAFGIWGYQQLTASGPSWIFGVGIALIVIPLALLYDALTNRKDKFLLEYAKNQPAKIVWIYHHILRMNGVPQESMMIGDDEGNIFKMPLVRRRGQEDELMNALVNTFPQAVIGFSHDLKKLYARNPKQFRELVMQQQ